MMKAGKRDFTINASKPITIGAIKQIVADTTGLPVAEQRLFIHGIMEYTDVSEAIIPENDDIPIKIFPTTESKEYVLGGSGEVTLTPIRGAQIILPTNGYTTIADIKRMVYDRQRMPISQQRLIFAQKELKDADRIDDLFRVYGERRPIHLIQNLPPR
jgi:hypothetical protein